MSADDVRDAAETASADAAKEPEANSQPMPPAELDKVAGGAGVEVAEVAICGYGTVDVLDPPFGR